MRPRRRTWDAEGQLADPSGSQRDGRQLGVDPAACLVVEDAPAGIASGRAAGCRTLAPSDDARTCTPGRRRPLRRK
ncbi:HAD-IA family hydrolase, partial [Streptomyces griseoincarnatus]